MKQIRMRKIILACLFLIVIMSVATVPVTAKTTLMRAYGMANYLNNMNNWEKYSTDRYYLKWNDNKNLGLPYQSSKTITKPDGTKIKGYTVCSPKNTYCGACTSFAESVSKSKYTTKDWEKGYTATKGVCGEGTKHCITAGTILATFDSNGYHKGGHSVVFVRYFRPPGETGATGMWVNDQSYYHDGAIALHKLMFTGKGGNSDAGSYSEVMVPS